MVVRLSLLESKVPLRRRVWPAGCGGAKRVIKKMFTPARFIDAVEYGGRTKGNKCARKLVAAFVPYSPYQL